MHEESHPSRPGIRDSFSCGRRPASGAPATAAPLLATELTRDPALMAGMAIGLGVIAASAAADGLLAWEFAQTIPAWVAGYAMPLTAVGLLRTPDNRTIPTTYESRVHR